ncbi:MAG: outer membrane lipoprotein chaperone LolA [Burkholderiales bacterium]|nr:outer membrane lipoprotein chaperone LolA [Burkholderiales bacterium]
MKFFLAIFVFMVSAASAAHAGSVDSLRTFVRETQTVRAHFAQTVLDRNGRSVSQASGVMAFSRPGKFRWTYDKPYEQLIVGDGVKLWIFDKDLNQVTVRKLDEALGSSPAALLAGNNEIEKFFALSDAGSRDGLDWLEASPKSKDTMFAAVRMGFVGNTLKQMELKDSFGQTTVIRFDKLERNPKLATDQFKFAPPKGADVIGE